ncbi:MAG: 3-methyl-2-oxobutanoate hydroxymethyltransferase [Actinomycetia bacterium]|nr:3-methyl-2-oxobutanoate hydroxymethyltransferase [Actinomycetes bacterium]
MNKEKVTTETIREKKNGPEQIIALTAWDYTSAQIVDTAGIDIVLVGDSLAMTIRGDENTLGITVHDMIYHTQMVSRACQRALVIADMPFMSYQLNEVQATRNAGRFLKAGGAGGVKIEGSMRMASTIEKITGAGIPVMGHIGLTPQSVHQIGGYKVQGKSLEPAKELVKDAKALQAAGVFSLVLECVPSELASFITDSIDIPTIGIGAGAGCDGQIQVTADVIGLKQGSVPKHAKKYTDLNHSFMTAVKTYAAEVAEGTFPTEANSFKSSDNLKQSLEKEDI